MVSKELKVKCCLRTNFLCHFNMFLREGFFLFPICFLDRCTSSYLLLKCATKRGKVIWLHVKRAKDWLICCIKTNKSCNMEYLKIPMDFWKISIHYIFLAC